MSDDTKNPVAGSSSGDDGGQNQGQGGGGSSVALPGVDPEFEKEDLKGYKFDPEHFEQKYDENSKPMRPNFSLIKDQEKRIEAKQIYLNALNKYIADKKAQISEFERKIRQNEEAKSKEEDDEKLAQLDGMLE